MNSEQVQQLLVVGGLLQFTASDHRAGPLTWAGIRMRDGLAVCTEPLPEDLTNDDDVLGWLRQEERSWFFAQDASPAWCFVDWHAGHGEPVPLEDSESLALLEDDDMSLLAAAVCHLAEVIYPDGWSKYEASEALTLDIIAVYPLATTGIETEA